MPDSSPRPNPDAVASREDLLCFVRALGEHLAANEGAVANPRTTDFLSAMVAWAEDVGAQGTDGSPWRQVAVLLLAASVYE